MVENINGAIEAILFANGDSLEFSRIACALEITEDEVKSRVSDMAKDYNEQNRGITIVTLENSCQLVSKKEFAPIIRTVMDLRRNTPLSQAALEVLAVVAYNQPVTKAYVEQVRGVDCSGVIGSLTAKGLVEERGRLELPGRPLLYGTTENFLRCFNISSLDELPPLPENSDNSEADKSGDADGPQESESTESADNGDDDNNAENSAAE